jgi:hypothetical protein
VSGHPLGCRKMIRTVCWFVCGSLIATVPGSSSAGGCQVPSYDPDRKLLPISVKETVHSDMRVAEILAALGPAHGDPCSGLYCPTWRLADGSRLVVTFSDPCGTPFRVEVKPTLAGESR